jgi:hypothetical protein
VGFLSFLVVFLSENLGYFSDFANVLILKFLDCCVVLSVLFGLCLSKCLTNGPKELVVPNLSYTVASNRSPYTDLIRLSFLPYPLYASPY